MNNFISQSISALKICLNPSYIPKNTHFFYKSETIECVLRGPWPIIYIKTNDWEGNYLDLCIQTIISLSHYGLINISDYFRFNSEEHYKWLFQNINQVSSISEITIAFQYSGIGNEETSYSRVKTNYLRNRTEWCVYSMNNYLPKKARSIYSPIIQELHINTHNCQRFIGNMYILNQNNSELISYFSSFITKSWRRHKAFLYPLPEEYCRQDRIKHKELPQKNALSVSKK